MVGSWRQLVAGWWRRLAVGGCWQLAAVGNWRLAVGGWWSLGAVLIKKNWAPPAAQHWHHAKGHPSVVHRVWLCELRWARADCKRVTAVMREGRRVIFSLRRPGPCAILWQFISRPVFTAWTLQPSCGAGLSSVPEKPADSGTPGPQQCTGWSGAASVTGQPPSVGHQPPSGMLQPPSVKLQVPSVDCTPTAQGCPQMTNCSAVRCDPGCTCRPQRRSTPQIRSQPCHCRAAPSNPKRAAAQSPTSPVEPKSPTAVHCPPIPVHSASTHNTHGALPSHCGAAALQHPLTAGHHPPMAERQRTPGCPATDASNWGVCLESTAVPSP